MSPGARAFHFGLSFTALLALPAALALVAGPPVAGFLWDWANLVGFVAFGCMLLPLFYTGRPRAFPPFSGRFFANLHRDIGYLALGLVLLHVGVLLYAEPLLLEHLKPAAPLYMLAGLVAALLCLLLVVPSITSLRRRLWRDYHAFRRLHGWLALLMLVMALWHVGASGFYLNHRFKFALLLYACVLLVFAYRAGRSRPTGPLGERDRVRGSAVYSHRVSVGACLILVASLSVLVWARHLE